MDTMGKSGGSCLVEPRQPPRPDHPVDCIENPPQLFVVVVITDGDCPAAGHLDESRIPAGPRWIKKVGVLRAPLEMDWGLTLR